MGERAQLLRKLDVLQSKLAGAERRLAEAKAHRLSLREEVGLSLDSVKVSGGCGAGEAPRRRRRPVHAHAQAGGTL